MAEPRKTSRSRAKASASVPEPAPEVEAESEGGAGPVAAPLDPPLVAEPQTDPPAGFLETSTNPVAPLAGVHSTVGETHRRLVGADGETVDPEEVFDDPGPRSTVVFFNQRVREEYLPDGGSRRLMRRLVGTAGQPVPRERAERLRREYAVPESMSSRAVGEAASG